MPQKIQIKALINASLTKVWEFWNNPEDVKQWNAASPDWHTTIAENDLRDNGKFKYRMEAKDGSFGFDFSGIYDTITPFQFIEYTLDDGRKVKTYFEVNEEDLTEINTEFEAEEVNSIEMQRTGWQAILDNFKQYVEHK
jgi:uncharacterized protein YndB with AHSA1/START domain